MSGIVEVDRVEKRYPIGPGSEHLAVKDVTFSVERGRVVCIVGKTGCGKSTLVNMLLGLVAPTRGKILIDGVNPSESFMGLRSKISAVFQTDRLLPWRTIVDNAALGLEVAGFDKKDRIDRAMVWLRKVGLQRWADAYPHQLSGGMRQRAAIARAFVLDTPVLLLDEAFGHLDEVTAHDLRSDCLGLVTETGKAVILVTHSINEALDSADSIIVLGRPASVIATFQPAELRELPDWQRRRDELRNEIFRLIETRSSELAITGPNSEAA
ncbi:ABC transporter ATP-binding protein [Bradyrhizobium diazoefficiens]|uniref:ABC transporter ATP-binding protein n=1 Tax=Bradyrhizobium diazoefficiens TaxID=1355477 RepID=UPI00346D5AA1